MRPSHTVTLYPNMIDWLCGELLGDGCLSPQSEYSAIFQYGSKYKEYAEYVSKTLQSFGIKMMGRIYTRIDKRWGCTTYKYQSLAYIELRMLYDMWYPKGKKIVPEGLMLPPVTLRQWYIGDGGLARSQRSRPYILLAPYSFSVDSVNWLVRQLVALGFKATRQLARNGVYISPYSTKDFLDYIGECPVECYEYKWDLGRTKSNEEKRVC